MVLKLNGESVEVTALSTVGELLDHFRVSHETVAVIANGAIVARDTFPDHVVHEGDALEIIRFVGGG